MFFLKSPLLVSLAAISLMTACARSGGVVAETEQRGIQTASIRGAPQAREAQNASLPLSELNTPEAIAAREATQRSSGSLVASSPSTAYRPAETTDSSTEEAEKLLLKADPHKKIDGLQKGSKVRVRPGALLRTRPSGTSEMMQSVPLPAELELGAQVYNAAGYWWYVVVGKESGWLLQSDIQL